MQIFEFHFNPKKKNRVSDSFCYEPEKSSKKDGYLYMAGELMNALPGSEQFLNNLAKTVKQEYYSEFYSSTDESIKKGLSRANDFLSSQVSKNNVGWLGNLNFAIISLDNKRNVNVAKIGNIKILLIRHGDTIDIGKKIDAQSDGPEKGFYTPRAFSRLTSGKMGKEDRITLITKELSIAFEEYSIIKEISLNPCLDQDILEKILNKHKEKFIKNSGIFFMIDAGRKKLLSEKENDPKKTFWKPFRHLPEDGTLEFSFKEVFGPLLKKCSFFGTRFISRFSIHLKRKTKKKEKKPALREKIIFKKIKLNERSNQAVRLTVLLIAVLILGFFVFQKNNTGKNETGGIGLMEIEETIEKADNFISRRMNGEAFKILQDAWNRIPFEEQRKEIIDTKEKIEDRLNLIGNLKTIENPELIFEFSSRDMIPQRIIHHNNRLYCFTPFSNKMVEIDTETKESREFFFSSEKNKGASSARIINNRPVFFLKPNKIFVFESGELKLSASLKEPSQNYDLNYFSNFWSSIYFWDSENKEILRYTHYEAEPEKWLHPQERIFANVQSMSVDGSVWLVQENYSIFRYSGGKFAEEIFLSVFPWPQKVSQIFTSPATYQIYLLEPAENKLIISDKKGNASQQFKSEAFNNLIHLSVSQDGNEIYLLNNLKIYRIKDLN